MFCVVKFSAKKNVLIRTVMPHECYYTPRGHGCGKQKHINHL
jgi:hypothetical protein